jgi:hypothetical protein
MGAYVVEQVQQQKRGLDGEVKAAVKMSVKGGDLSVAKLLLSWADC